MADVRITDYDKFWPFYLREHRKKETRRLHYVGSSLGLLFFAIALFTGRWLFVPLGVVSGYTCAWVSHFFVECNRPATFKYPGWSWYSDFRMYFLWLAGKLDAHLQAAGVPSG